MGKTTCDREMLAAGTPTGTNPCEMLQRSISMPALDPTKSTLLSPACGSTLRSLPGMFGGPSVRTISRKSLDQADGSRELHKWLATRTVATRDPYAAGHAG